MSFSGMLPDAETLKQKMASRLGGNAPNRSPLASQFLGNRAPQSDLLSSVAGVAGRPGRQNPSGLEEPEYVQEDESGEEVPERELPARKAAGKKTTTRPKVRASKKVLDYLDDLIDKEGFGIIGQFDPSDTARENRGLFTSMQATLLPLYKEILPRMTEKEFKYITEVYMPKIGDTVSTMKGKIKGLRELAKYYEDENPPNEPPRGGANQKKAKFNPANPEHAAKMKQLEKAHKGNRKKVNEDLAREFE